MGSKDEEKMAFYEKLGRLRSAANSTDMNKATIVVDESVQSAVSSRDQQSSLPAVKVETLEKRFLINVFSGKSCPGLLVSILEAFEGLGLDVLDARVSCSDKFQLEAVGESEGQSHSIDEQVVRDAVWQAIMNWNDDPDQD